MTPSLANIRQRPDGSPAGAVGDPSLAVREHLGENTHKSKYAHEQKAGWRRHALAFAHPFSRDPMESKRVHSEAKQFGVEWRSIGVHQRVFVFFVGHRVGFW